MNPSPEIGDHMRKVLYFVAILVLVTLPVAAQVSAIGSASSSTGGGSSLPVVDSTAVVKGSADATKLVFFSAANLTTGTSRTIFAPDSNTYLPITSQFLTFTGPTAARTITLPDAAFTVARTDAAQTFTGKQVISSAGSTIMLALGSGTSSGVGFWNDTTVAQGDGPVMTIVAGDQSSYAGINAKTLRVQAAGVFGNGGTGVELKTAAMTGYQNFSAKRLCLATDGVAAFDAGFDRVGAGSLNLNSAAGLADGTLNLATVKAGDAAAGTNVTGNAVTLKDGAGRGSGAGGGVNISTTPAGSSGSSLNTAVVRYKVAASGVALTSGAAATIVNVALPTLTMAGGTIDATIQVTNGTDVQAFHQIVEWSAVNKGGVYTTNATATAGSKSVSAGTLTTAWTVLTGSNTIAIQVAPTTSLTTPTIKAYFTVTNNSEQAPS